jgi:uncharacterized protein GlcG (DUF336 family)
MIRLALACLAVGSIAAAARAELPVHHDLPQALAVALAQASIEACVAKGYPESAVVVNAAGETIVAIRGDGAASHTLENARRKADTAMRFRMSITEYAK